MKNVAGFHSLDFFLNCRFSFRKGFGIKERQNWPSAMVTGAVLDLRIPKLEICDALNASDTVRI